MINTGTTGVLGVAYWLMAARRYAVVDVGRASAAYSVMRLVSGFTALNLTGALTRFIPQSGGRTAALVARTYAVSAVAAVAIAVPFLLTVNHWGPSYAELSGVTAGLIFTTCVITWGIFTLQDGVLTGLRSAIWVPIENGIFGIVKIALLVALAAALPHVGIFVSWMLPVAISLPLINLLIFGKLVPRHAQATAARLPPTRKQIARFLAGDYTGALCVLATTTLVPVLVAVRIDPGMNAYFYVAWVIGGTLDLFAVNMATSLTVEGSFDAATLGENCRAALRRAMLILVPIAAGLALVAPWALALFGRGYATHGAVILELLAVATLPKAVTEIYIGALRAQSRTSLIALIQAVRGALVLGLALALTGLVGITGAAVAVLASQTLVAVLVASGLRRVFAGVRRQPVPGTADGDIHGTPARDQATAGADSGPPAGRPSGGRPARLPAGSPSWPPLWALRRPSRWLPVAPLFPLATGSFALFPIPLLRLDLPAINGPC